MWSNFGAKKILTRIPYKQSAGRRDTFCVKLDFGQIDFFTSSWSPKRPQLLVQTCNGYVPSSPAFVPVIAIHLQLGSSKSAQIDAVRPRRLRNISESLSTLL